MPYNHLILDLVLDVVRLDLEALHILPLGLVPGLDGLVFLILPPCSPRVCLFLIKYASLISASKYEKRKWTTLDKTENYSRIERTGPKTVVSFTVVQFHRLFLNWNWHSPIPFRAPRPTWTMWSV